MLFQPKQLISQRLANDLRARTGGQTGAAAILITFSTDEIECDKLLRHLTRKEREERRD